MTAALDGVAGKLDAVGDHAVFELGEGAVVFGADFLDRPESDELAGAKVTQLRNLLSKTEGTRNWVPSITYA